MAPCLTVATLTLGLIVLKSYEWLYRPGPIVVDPQTTPFWGPRQLNSYFLALLDSAFLAPMYDSAGQRLSLALMIAMVGLILLFAPIISRLRPIFDNPSLRRGAQGLAIVAAFVAYVFAMKRSSFPIRLQLLSAIVGLAVTVVVAVLAARTRHGVRNRLIMTVLIIFVLSANLPALFTRIDVSRLSEFGLIYVEHHFSVVLGQADRLAVGHRLGEFVYPTYGFLLHLLLAWYQRDVRALTMGQTIFILQCLQFLYLALCVIVLVRHTRSNAALCLFASLLVVPWYHFFNNALLYPNQSAWRTLGFPVALLCIRLLYKAPRAYASFVSGVIGAWLVLINVESGIAATAGLVAALFYRTGGLGRERRWRDAMWIAPFLLGMVVCGVAFLTAWRFCLGYWPPASLFSDIFARVSNMSGFAGLRYDGALMPLALLAWSILIIVYFAITAGHETSPADSVRIGAAAIALVWLLYYANRADFWNTSSFGILYAIAALDAARRVTIGVRRRRFGNVATAFAFALTAIVTVPSIGSIVLYNALNVASFRAAVEPLTWISWRLAQPPGTVELSGVILREEIGNELTTKTRGLIRIGQERPLIFLTPHSYMIPKLSGLHAQFPGGDLFGESLTKRQYDGLVTYIKATRARAIYVDPVVRDVPTYQSYHWYFAFYDMLLRDIGTEYRANGYIDGWEIWVRKGGA
jgi:hypothetical protein